MIACGTACWVTHLQIAVHDAQGVHVTHSTSKLGEDLCSVVLCVSLQCLDTVQQHAASAERQDQEDDTALSIVEGCAARENEVQAILLCEGRVCQRGTLSERCTINHVHNVWVCAVAGQLS